MIRARGLVRRFGSLVAVDNVSLQVADGTLLALLGPNGAGKTTTVRMLCGLLAPSHGTANVAGCDVATQPAAVRARVGLVTDVPGLFDQMTPDAYLQFFGRLYGLDEATRATRIDALLRLFELDDRRNARMAAFSRGMQQKVALARALLHEPSVLFLDEPTAGLDPLAARSVRELILSLKHARRSIVLCTHDLDEAERLADQVAIMQEGRILALDAPGTLRQLASPETTVRITLAAPLSPEAPDGVLVVQTAEPKVSNPRLVSELVARGAQIVSVTSEPRTLEDVYAAAINGEAALFAPKMDEVVQPEEGTLPIVNALPNDGKALVLIARRAAIESLNDRMTRLLNVFFALIAPVALLVLVVKPLDAAASDLVATVLPFYVLVIGTMPAVGAVGIAAGQFAGEKERGVLTPMLASPASNLAIFGGKVLGAVMPPVLYSAIAEVIYLLGIVVLLGVDRLTLVQPALLASMLLLVPGATCLAAIVGALVSSRVRTYNAAQQIAGLLLIPVWAGLFALAFQIHDWGFAGLVATVGGVVVLDTGLTVLAALTWRREEVLSQR